MAPSGLRRHADDDRPVELLGLAIAERVGQALGRLPGARDQQQAAGVLVEPMDQPRPLLEAEAQRIEHAVDMALRCPLPPCTARPGGLLSTITWSSLVDDQAAGSPAASRSETVGISARLGRRRSGDARRQADRSGRARRGPCPRRACRRCGPGRCAAASAARRGSARGNGAGTSGRGADRPRRRRRHATWTLAGTTVAGLSLMARNLRDKLQRVHGIGVVRHADVRPSGRLPAGANYRDPAYSRRPAGTAALHGDPDQQRRRPAPPRALLRPGC